jgi:hypothetical protein
MRRWPSATRRAGALEALRCLQCKNAPASRAAPCASTSPPSSRHRRGRFPGGRRHHQAQQPAAGRLRPRLPAGDAVPGELHGRQGAQGRREGRLHRPARALRGRLGAREGQGIAARGQAAHRQARWPWSAAVRPASPWPPTCAARATP